MLDALIAAAAAPHTLHVIAPGQLDNWLQGQSDAIRGWVAAHAFKPDAGRLLVLPGAGGPAVAALLGLGARPDLWTFGGLAQSLPEGDWTFAGLDPALSSAAALGFALGAYAFDRYRGKPRERKPARLVWPAQADRAQVTRSLRAAGLARDLINTPAQDLGPAELAAAAGAVAVRHGARYAEIIGPDLLTRNFPLIHAVGRASARPPRLIELGWGDASAPSVVLVGKGVVFDSGGLDLKGASGMALMKKDMGGAATALALADMVMDAGLKVNLRVLLPAVENAVSGNAFRPGDVFQARSGLTVEVGNTDAEGRLILADALAYGDEGAPDLMIDFATLTGAARVALGPDLPALFSDDDKLAGDILAAGVAQADPLWRLPLYAPYRAMIDSKIADINNAGEDGMAGSITAGLFLKDFVTRAKAWAHIDLYAWNAKPRPGRPVGGEAMTARAIFSVLAARYQ